MPRKKTRPQKPAKHTGVVIFPKSGPVTKIVEDWPRTQEEQELRVVEMFATTMAAWNDRHFEDVQPLPESDHDIVAIEAGVQTEIQVTELVTKGVLRDLGGAFGWTEGDFDDLLVRAIVKKVERYGRTRQCRLMLLVYSVDPGALKFCESSRSDPETGTRKLHVPEPLEIARRYLAEHGAGPFDEVWFTAPSPEWAQVSPVFPPSLYD